MRYSSDYTNLKVGSNSIPYPVYRAPLSRRTRSLHSPFPHTAGFGSGRRTKIRHVLLNLVQLNAETSAPRVSKRAEINPTEINLIVRIILIPYIKERIIDFLQQFLRPQSLRLI